MRRLFLLFAILLILGLYSYVNAEKSTLSRSFFWTIGDWVAYRLSEDFRVIVENQQAKFQDPSASASSFARYDRKRDVIVVQIYGGRKKVEECKNSITYWQNYIKKPHIPEMSTYYGIYLNENDYVVIYINRVTNEEIIRLENERFLLPKE